MLTLTFDTQRLNLLRGMITAAGKSPNTTPDDMISCAEMLVWIAQQEQAAKEDKPSNVIDLPKEAS